MGWAERAEKAARKAAETEARRGARASRTGRIRGGQTSTPVKIRVRPGRNPDDYCPLCATPVKPSNRKCRDSKCQNSK